MATCCYCNKDYSDERSELGYKYCLAYDCANKGMRESKEEFLKEYTPALLHKSNYVWVKKSELTQVNTRADLDSWMPENNKEIIVEEETNEYTEKIKSLEAQLWEAKTLRDKYWVERYDLMRIDVWFIQEIERAIDWAESENDNSEYISYLKGRVEDVELRYKKFNLQRVGNPGEIMNNKHGYFDWIVPGWTDKFIVLNSCWTVIDENGEECILHRGLARAYDSEIDN